MKYFKTISICFVLSFLILSVNTSLLQAQQEDAAPPPISEKAIPCQCTSWVTHGCGLGPCTQLQLYSSRSCSPSGCMAQDMCTESSSCCTGWTPVGACGAPACPSGHREFMRTCGTGLVQKVCRPDPKCAACQCTPWVPATCGAGNCAANERLHTRNCNLPGCGSQICKLDGLCCTPYVSGKCGPTSLCKRGEREFTRICGNTTSTICKPDTSCP